MKNRLFHHLNPLLLVQAWFLLVLCRILPLAELRIASAQEAPTLTLPKFATPVVNNNNTNTFRHDICNRHVQLIQDEIALPDALRGLNLSVVLTDYGTQPVSQELFALTQTAAGANNGSQGVIPSNPTPLFAIVLDELAKRAGFKWRHSFGVVRPIHPSEDGNRTWSDLLQWEVETYDIAMGRWDRTTERMKNAIHFPEGYVDSSIILVQLDGKKNATNIWSFLLPFQSAVWFMIVLVLIVTGLLYYFLERLDHASDSSDIEHEPGSAIYYSFITFTGHNEYRPRTTAARLLAFSATLFALITGAAYTANLASFLVARHQNDMSFPSLAAAVLVGAPICVQGGVALDEFVSTQHPAAVLVRKDSTRGAFLGLKNGDCQLALAPQSEYDSFRRNKEVNENCHLSTNGRVEKFVPSGLATFVDTGSYCTSLIGHVLDYHLIEMKADGFFAAELEAFLSRVGNQECASDAQVAVKKGLEDDEERFSLSLSDMSGIFIVHAVFSVIALLATLIKYYYSERRRRREADADPDDPTVKLSSSARRQQREEGFTTDVEGDSAEEAMTSDDRDDDDDDPTVKLSARIEEGGITEGGDTETEAVMITDSSWHSAAGSIS